MQGNGGTGLGLTIVRQILSLHSDSELEIRSDGHGHGTIFEMRIRCRIARPPPASPSKHSSEPLPSPHAPSSRAGSDSASRKLNVPPGSGSADVHPFESAGGGSKDSSSNFETPDSSGHGGARIPAEAAPATAVPPGFRCLHAEDDHFVRLTMPLQTFDVLGLPYDQVDDGAAAVEAVSAGQRYDVIVMDNQ